MDEAGSREPLCRGGRNDNAKGKKSSASSLADVDRMASGPAAASTLVSRSNETSNPTARRRLFRCIYRTDKPWGDGVTERVVWHVVNQYARKLGLPHVAPHDLRCSCAKLRHRSGGELEQIQFLLGHVPCRLLNAISPATNGFFSAEFTLVHGRRGCGTLGSCPALPGRSSAAGHSS